MTMQKTIDNLVAEEVQVGDLIKLKEYRPFRVAQINPDFTVDDKYGNNYRIKNVNVFKSALNTFEITYYRG